MSDFRLDGYRSLITKLGVDGYDKRESATFRRVPMSRQEALALWRGSWLAGRIVEKPVAQAVRGGFDVVLGEDDSGDEVEAALDDLGAMEVLAKAWRYARAFGGGGVFVGAVDAGARRREDGTADLSAPLILTDDDDRGARSTITSVRHLTAYEGSVLVPVEWYGADSTGPRYGQPMIYEIRPNAMLGTAGATARYTRVHESRILKFHGVRTTDDALADADCMGWGDSVLARVRDEIRAQGVTWQAVEILLYEYSIGNLFVTGLRDLLLASKEEEIAGLIRNQKLLESVMGRRVLDKDLMDFKRDTIPLTGLPEILDRMMIVVAAAADMTVTALFGRSAAGMNATGEGDARNDEKAIAALQASELRGPLETLVKMLLQSKRGPTRGVEPETWQVKFRPLSQPTQQERATMYKTTTEADVAAVNAGIYTPLEVADTRSKSDGMFRPIELDTEARDAMAKAREDLPLDMPGEQMQNPSQPASPAGQSSSEASTHHVAPVR